MDVPILIVGGGPTGPAASTALSRRHAREGGLLRGCRRQGAQQAKGSMTPMSIARARARKKSPQTNSWLVATP